MMWDGFVKNNPMVFMVLNGHTHTEYALVNHNAKNRPVYQMLSDYQDRANCGNGLMRLVTIDPAQNKILVRTFSPYYNNADANYFETDADSQFEYDVNVKERLAFDTSFDFGPEPPAPPLPPLNAIPATVALLAHLPEPPAAGRHLDPVRRHGGRADQREQRHPQLRRRGDPDHRHGRQRLARPRHAALRRHRRHRPRPDPARLDRSPPPSWSSTPPAPPRAR